MRKTILVVCAGKFIQLTTPLSVASFFFGGGGGGTADAADAADAAADTRVLPLLRCLFNPHKPPLPLSKVQVDGV